MSRRGEPKELLHDTSAPRSPVSPRGPKKNSAVVGQTKVGEGEVQKKGGGGGGGGGGGLGLGVWGGGGGGWGGGPSLSPSSR